ARDRDVIRAVAMARQIPELPDHERPAGKRRAAIGDHRGRDVDPDDVGPGVEQRARDGAGAAAELEHGPVLQVGTQLLEDDPFDRHELPAGVVADDPGREVEPGVLPVPPEGGCRLVPAGRLSTHGSLTESRFRRARAGRRELGYLRICRLSRWGSCATVCRGRACGPGPETTTDAGPRASSSSA